MSADGSGTRVGREVAHRLFAAEYDDASLSYAESDDERAPNYVITPTGARVNRIFVAGTLTEVSSVNEEMVRARVVDPTGAFVVYAGQYQPDELAFLERAEPPLFVAVTGKARTFEPDDGDRVYTSIRPESVATVDGDTRDRWVVDAAERTLDRIATYAAASNHEQRGEDLTAALRESDVPDGLADGIPIAQDHYGTTPAYLAALRERALDAVRVVAGEREQVEPLDVSPGETGRGDASFAALAAERGIEVPESPSTAPRADAEDGTAESTVATSPEDDDPGSAGAVVGTAEASSTASTDGTDPDGDAAVADVDAGDGETADEAGAASGSADDPTDDTSGEDDADELGDFESSGLGDELYELDEEEREEIEAEYGTEFTTGTEVDDPGEADIDVPEPERPDDGASVDGDDEASAAEVSETEGDDEVGTEGTDGTGTDDTDGTGTDDTDGAEAGVADEPADDVDLQEVVVETMSELDDGDGADREAVVDAVTDETGAPSDAVEDAIQDALMGGQCYEPDDETLKAI